MYKLRSWIDIDRLEWFRLSKNPLAINLLEKNKNKINFTNLSKNLNAIHILGKNQLYEFAARK